MNKTIITGTSIIQNIKEIALNQFRQRKMVPSPLSKGLTITLKILDPENPLYKQRIDMHMTLNHLLNKSIDQHIQDSLKWMKAETTDYIIISVEV
jgi:hypothetical protein